MIVGVTGVFGSGKTTVASLFAKHGYKHINADEIGHKLLDQYDVKGKILDEFGFKILSQGKVDRRKLKEIVFKDHSRLIKLNKIIHPFIIEEIINKIKYYKKNKIKDIVVDAALLIEVHALNIVDKLVVIKIKKQEQMKRILKKKKYNKTEIDNIIKSQMSQGEKLKYADIIIDTSKSIKHTEMQVKKIMGVK